MKVGTALASPWPRIGITLSAAWLVYVWTLKPWWYGTWSHRVENGDRFLLIPYFLWHAADEFHGGHNILVTATIGVLFLNLAVAALAWIWHAARPRKA